MKSQRVTANSISARTEEDSRRVEERFVLYVTTLGREVYCPIIPMSHPYLNGVFRQYSRSYQDQVIQYVTIEHLDMYEALIESIKNIIKSAVVHELESLFVQMSTLFEDRLSTHMQNSLESNLWILYQYQSMDERGDLDPDQWSTFELLKKVQEDEDYYNDMSKPAWVS